MSENAQLKLIARILEASRARKLSKREFLRFSVAAGVTASMATHLWASKVAQAAPSKGGTFRLGMHDGNTGDSHDPGNYISFGMIQLGHTYRSYLTMINADNTLGPDIAESWEASKDAKAWTFKINKNAQFHDGKSVTADDVIASMNHHRGDDTKSAAKALLADVVELVKDDNHTVTFKLSGGNADLPWLMTDYHLAICPANPDGTMEWQSGNGSGPYKIISHEPGVATKLERHDGWHHEGAYFDAVEMVVLNDLNARQAALVTGQIDAVTQVDLKTKSLLQRDRNIEIDDVPSGSAITMPMHTNMAPFDDVNVRTALKLAIDRQEVIDKVAFGSASLGNDFHVSPNMPYWPDDIPQRTYDPEQAKSLLKKAGMEGLTVEISVAESVYPGAVDMCVLYAQQAKAAGINLNVNRVPNDGYYSNIWLKKPFCVAQCGARPTPDVMFSLAYKDDAAWNESYWQNERFNKLLREAKSELDQAKRATLYREMCQIARDDGGTVIPMFANFVYARRKNVRHGPSLAASWQCDGARACSRWWFES